MLKNRLLVSVAALAGAGVLCAQEQTRLAGPTTGFMYDAPSRAIRVVMGVPGSAYLGRAVASDLDLGSVSPDGRWAVSAGNGELLLIDLASGAVSRLGAGSAEQIAWNEASTAVAAVRGGVARLYRLNGGVAEAVALAEFRGNGAPVAVDANAVYMAGDGGVYRVDNESAKLLAPAGEVSGLTLAGGTLYAADKTNHQILAIGNLTGSPEVRLALGAAQGIDEPVALGAARDGSRLFVAEKARTLSAFNPGTGELSSRVELDFDASRLDPVGGSLYLLRARAADGDTVQLLDARQMTVYFVPAQDLASVANLED